MDLRLACGCFHVPEDETSGARFYPLAPILLAGMRVAFFLPQSLRMIS